MWMTSKYCAAIVSESEKASQGEDVVEDSQEEVLFYISLTVYLKEARHH